jgi:FkbM family methyltransferase
VERTNEIDGYADIHHNMRFWMSTLVATLDDARTADGRRGGDTNGRFPSPIVIYDIGANDGELTLPIARDREGVRIVAFEPQPGVRARLMAKAADAGLSVALWGEARVTVVPLALGDGDEMIELEVYSDDTFSSRYARPAEELARYELEMVEAVTVRMRPLDDLVAADLFPPPDIIKIDVEGAERSVLAGARSLLAAHNPPVLVEFSCPNTTNAGYDRREILTELRAAGYDRISGLFRNEDHSLYGEESFADCRIWNLLALRSDRDPALTAQANRFTAPWKE